MPEIRTRLVEVDFDRLRQRRLPRGARGFLNDGPTFVCGLDCAQPVEPFALQTLLREFRELAPYYPRWSRSLWRGGEIRSLLVHAWSDLERQLGVSWAQQSSASQDFAHHRWVVQAARLVGRKNGARDRLIDLAQTKVGDLQDLLEGATEIAEESRDEDMINAVADEANIPDRICRFVARYGFLGAPKMLATRELLTEAQQDRTSDQGFAFWSKLPRGERLDDWLMEFNRLATLRAVLRPDTGRQDANERTTEKLARSGCIQFGSMRAKGVPPNEFTLDVLHLNLTDRGFVREEAPSTPVPWVQAWQEIKACAHAEVSRILDKSTSIDIEGGQVVMCVTTVRGALYLALLESLSEHPGAKLCIGCGNIIKNRRRNARYCSDGCQKASENKRYYLRKKSRAAETDRI